MKKSKIKGGIKMNENIILKTIAVMLGSCFAYAIGEVDKLFTVLLTFIVIDYLTGIAKAYCNKELSSKIGFNGLMKKIGILVAVIVANQMDKIDPSGAQLFRNVTVTFFVANEGISLLENLSQLGVPIPSVIKTALKIWKNDAEKGSEKESEKEVI